MNKKSTLAMLVVFGLISLFTFYIFQQEPVGVSELAVRNQGYNKPDKRTRMDLAMEQEIARTKDPNLGYVPAGRMQNAIRLAEKKRLSHGDHTIAGKAIDGVSWRERGPSNVGGRTRAIMIDPNDVSGKTIWSASVSGGLWKTTDITKASPDWEPVDDTFDNMAITSMAYDPTDTDVMYFGTGEGFFNVDAVEGNGIWKSTDGGATWNQLAATNTTNTSTCAGTGNCDFLFVNDIKVTSSGTVLAATRSRYTNRGGVMRSTDGGNSWTNILEGLSGTNPCNGGTYRHRASDLEIAADGDIFVAFGLFEGQGIWRSQDDGANWTQVYATSTATCDEQRIEIAVAPNDADYLYALVQENDNSIKTIMRSVDGGDNWADVGDPTPLWFDQECTTGSDDFTRGQAWYDLIAAVDPNDRDVVYIGGIDLLRTTDGGANWTQLTNWAGNCDLPEVHADQHQIIYQEGSSDVMYIGNDGGIYRTTDGSAASPVFERKEFNYNTTQFYSVAMHPTAFSPEYIGGAQDNGSNKVSSLGISTTVESTGGDGGFAHIDQDNPDIWITAFTNANISRSLDGGLTFSTVLTNNGGSFINPSDYDNTSNVYYGGFTTDTYFFSSDLSVAGAPSWFSSGAITEMGGGTITHVSVSQNTTNRVFFGLNNGNVVRVDDANNSITATNITGPSFPGGSVSCIAIEDGNDDHLLVTFTNYGVASVWETTDGGATWTDVEGDLPDMPVRWALFNPNNSDQAIIATELGVWSTDNLNGGSTEWEPSNDGLANVRTDMLQIRSSDNLVVAATHGRGFFTTDVFTSPNADFVADRKAIYAEASINFTDASYKATSWEWDFGDGGTSTEENPTHTYQRSGKYAVTLTINGGAATETKTDYIHVLPNLPTPFTAADGGDFESNPDYFGSDDLTGGINLWERGAPSNDITTLNSGTNGWKTDLDADIIQADYSSALYSPNFNMSAAGSYELSFRKSMAVRFANAPQAVQVQYSTDNGNNWTRLGVDNDPNGTNWYERGPSSAFAIETDVIFDRYGFSNIYDNELTTYDISFLAGNSTVAFRFVHYVAAGYSAVGYQEDGFMVDDFEITGTINEANVNITENSPGSALSFDGTDDYATLFDLEINESFTAEMWLSPATDANGQTFLAKHDASGNDIFGIGYSNDGIQVTVGSQSVVGGTRTTGLQHLAVTVEKLTGSSSEVTVYRDGAEVYQSTVNDVIGTSTGLDWVIGQDWDGVGVTSEFFEGTVDELRIWNVVRTADEIRDNNFLIVDALDTDLIGYWQFNENNGTSASDAITGNEGTLVNGTAWVTSTASVAKGTSNSTTVTADGVVDLGTLDIDFAGVSGSFEVVVFELENSPSGTSPSEDFTLTELVDNPFYVINVYGTGSFTSSDLTYTYGAGVFTETDPTQYRLFKRPSSSSGSWSDAAVASSVNTATGVIAFDGITSFSQTTVGIPDESLPVELNAFRGKRLEGNTLLEWETLSETDNERFDVLRSNDGENWSVVGSVSSLSANGNSNVALSYQFTDRDPVESTVVYYRLRQHDFHGTSELSEMIVINIGILPAAMKIYPNPVRDELSLYISSEANSKVSLEVIGMNGKTYFTRSGLEVSRGEMVEKIDVSQLNNGLYLLVYRDGDQKRIMKFIVSR